MKRSQHRMPVTLGRSAYPSDLTDEQWELLEPLVPPVSPDAAYTVHTRREIVNGILYVLRSGCPWRSLPHDLPAWGTVYDYFRCWQRDGIWEQILEALRRRVRQKQGRNEEPSAAIIDSQSIKTSAVRGPEKGYDPGKKIWGRKRHVFVDTQGHLLGVKVLAANSSDPAGARALLEPLKEKFPTIEHLWGDSTYRGKLIGWVAEHLGWTLEVVLGIKPEAPDLTHLTPTQIIAQWNQLFPNRCRLHPRRWVIERTFGWIVRWRRLCRDHEGLPGSSEALIKIAMSTRMLHLLAPSHPSY